MMIAVKAGYFDVECDWSGAAIGALLARQGKLSAPDVPHSGEDYRLTDVKWSATNRILSGTVWRVRKKNLPRGWRGNRPRTINADLAEGASFAYSPDNGLALIQYNHHGPRHRIVGYFFEGLGIKGPVILSPRFRDDALERLRHAALVGRFEYALGPGVESEPLDSASIQSSIDQMNVFGGHSIRVSISLARQPRKSKKGSRMIPDQAKAKSAIEALMNLPGVRGLKATYKATESHKMELLDLLGSHRVENFEVAEAGREIDHPKCRSRLRRALRAAINEAKKGS